MKDLRQLMILAVVFIILAGALLMQGGSADRQASDPTPIASPDPTAFMARVFPDMEVLRIQAIRLYDPNRDRAITLTRDDDGQWRSPEVVQPLNQETAADIARTIVLMPYLDHFTLQEESELTQYGFHATGSYFFIQFLTVDGEQHTLAIGNPADILINEQPVFYALVDDSPEMLLVYRGAVNFLVDYFLNPATA